jgi:hypothetical protein
MRGILKGLNGVVAPGYSTYLSQVFNEVQLLTKLGKHLSVTRTWSTKTDEDFS